MKKKSAAIVLFAASTSTAVAIGDPAPTKPTTVTVQPLTLRTGSPACGNVMIKSYGAPKPCVSMSALITAAVDGIREIRETVAVFATPATIDPVSLTLAEEGRPRS
jgi:hypothetical protein